MRQLVLIAALLIALGAWHGESHRQESAAQPLTRCGYRWTIPAEHSLPLAWLQQVMRGGEERARISPDWSGEHLAVHIPGYQAEVEGVTGDVSGSIHVIPHEQLYRYETARDGDPMADAFTRSGDMYGGWVVTENPTPPGFYRILDPEREQRRHPRQHWIVSRVDPRSYDAAPPREEWYVATCRWAGGNIAGTDMFESCTFLTRLARDIHIRYHLRGPNIALHEEVLTHITRHARSWVTVPEDDPNCFDDPFESFPTLLRGHRS